MSLSIITWNAQGGAKSKISTMLAHTDIWPEVVLLQEAGVDFELGETISSGTTSRPKPSYVVASKVFSIGSRNDRCTTLILVREDIGYTFMGCPEEVSTIRPVECVSLNGFSCYVMNIHAISSSDATTELISVLQDYRGILEGANWILGGDFNALPAETTEAIARHAEREDLFQKMSVSSSGESTHSGGHELDYFIHSSNIRGEVSRLDNTDSDHWPVLGVF